MAASTGQANQQRLERGPAGAFVSGRPVAAPPVTGYVCPRCHGPLLESHEAYSCRGCSSRYPIVLGIPDFRVFPDPWIGLEDDREKARRLEERSAGMDFEATVREYWTMTPTTPAPLAERFTRHVLAAGERSRQWLARTAHEDGGVPAGPWLDLGCGTGDLMAAAPESVAVVGVDIALRWLIAARKRPGVTGAHRALVCACAEALPFNRGSFARVLSLGTLEHVGDAAKAASEAGRVLTRGGLLRLRTLNRYTPLAEPHVNVWGVGLVPRRWSDAYVRMRSGQRYLWHRPLSPRELGAVLRRAGLSGVTVRAAPLLQSERESLGALGDPVASLIDSLRDAPLLGTLLPWMSHLMEARGEVQ